MSLKSFQYVHYHNVRIPMRDGITLGADVYLPLDNGRFPVILNRSPYGPTNTLQNADRCAKGYAVVHVDCRGRFLSDGICTPCRTEIEDGFDTLEWISRQDFCDGNIGMVGGSYPGLTQLTAAASGHPALKAIAPSAISADMFDVYFTHGVPELSFMPSWHIGCMCSRDIQPPPSPDWPALIRETPLGTLDKRAGIPCPSWHDLMENVNPDTALWQTLTLKNHARNLSAPFFIQTSYFDLLGRKGPEIYTELMNDPATPESFKRNSFLRIGPWGHGVNMQEGEYSFGPESIVTEDWEIDFLDSMLKGKKAPDTAALPGRIQYFTMGENKWHFSDFWPPENTVAMPFYLAGNGHANTLHGDGRLTTSAPESTSPDDCFISDPENPVPTCGGRIVNAGGQRDQSEVEQRADVLVYTSEPLTEDLTVAGVVKAHLFVASNTPDSDFTVKLVDVSPDGRPLNLCDTIYRMRYRNGFSQEKIEMMKPGIFYEIAFDVDFTSYMFHKGNRIRVEIAGSNFPHYPPNPNTDADPLFETQRQTALQRVAHSHTRPSAVILPVLQIGKNTNS